LLDSLWLVGYEQEIDRCKKLYDDFSDGADYVESIFSVLDQCFTKSPDAFVPNELPIALAEEATDLMRKDQSLRFRPDLETNLFVDLFNTVCKETAKKNPAIKPIFIEIIDKADSYFADKPKMISIDEIDKFRRLLIEETAMENDMATFLFSIVLSSIYRRQLESIAEVLRTDLYEGGDCPLCGEKPHYGMLRAEDGAKQLECWLCGTRWVHTRVKCPYCRNEEREELGYFTIEGKDICRVNYCRACSSYCKIFDLRQLNMDGDVVLAIHNLATLNHDLLAGKEGFKPGSGLEWVNDPDLMERED
jgi:formate dehydrogenase maturation protein FdhE